MSYFDAIIDACNIDAAKDGITKNPGVLFEKRTRLNGTRYVLDFLLSRDHFSTWEFTVFLCEIIDAYEFTDAKDKKFFLRRLFREDGCIMARLINSVTFHVFNDYVSRTKYMIEKLGPEEWEKSTHVSRPLSQWVRSEKMLDLLIETHPEKERILLREVSDGYGRPFSFALAALTFVSPKRYLDFLKIPEIREILRQNAHSEKTCCWHIQSISPSRVITKVFFEEELNLLANVSEENSFSSLVMGIISLETLKKNMT